MSRKSTAYTKEEKDAFTSELSTDKGFQKKILDYIFIHGEKNTKNYFYLKFHNTLTNEEETTEGNHKGKVREELIRTLLPAPDNKTLILLCGRGKMCKKYLKPMLYEMGYQQDNVFIF